MRRLLQVLPILAILMVGSLRAAVQVGDKLHLSLRTTSGMRITTSDLKGHLLVVDFWATWCHPCMMEVPHIVRLYKKYSRDGVGFLGVSLDDDLGTMQAVAKAHGIVWPQVFQGQDWHDPIVSTWGVRGIPATFLLGPDGTVLWNGYPTGLGPAIRHALKKYPPQVIFEKQTLKIFAAATHALQKKHDYRLALRLLQTMPRQVQTGKKLRKPARALVWAIYKSGKPAVAALLADVPLSKRLGAMVGGMGRLRELLHGYR